MFVSESEQKKKSNVFFWKNKRVSEKVFKKRSQQSDVAKKLKGLRRLFQSPNLKSHKIAQDSNSTVSIPSTISDVAACAGNGIVAFTDNETCPTAGDASTCGEDVAAPFCTRGRGMPNSDEAPMCGDDASIWANDGFARTDIDGSPITDDASMCAGDIVGPIGIDDESSPATGAIATRTAGTVVSDSTDDEGSLTTSVAAASSTDISLPEDFSVEGRRIIHVKTLARQMFCHKCKSQLFLGDITEEKRFGLASVFYIMCKKCHKNTGVSTDQQHRAPNGRLHYNVNTEVVLGVLNGGLGNTHLNKVLTSGKIPELYWKTYKTYEKEVGEAVEKYTQESCMAAAKEERRLTIQNVDAIKKLLPSHLETDFIFPGASVTDVQNRNISDNMIVRIAGSFDMGWFTRGTGRSYDSLSGTGALIGYFSKKVIAYTVLNRKCKMCDAGHSVGSHDCRLNFVGSAKAMEPKAAVLLTNDNPILNSSNLEVGIIIADNDSSSICAVRSVSKHEVVKQADKNHTSKGVVNELYKIKKNYKELTANSISYLQKNFNYCVSQNQGDSLAMAKAIENIPFHCFNIHDNCGKWCNYHKNPETYKHSIIGDGFQDDQLFEALKSIFNNIATKTDHFVAGASSNPNESLNSMIVSKAPKTRQYGTSSSGSIRVACAISKKNEGEKYVADISTQLLLSPSKHKMKFCERVDSHAKKRFLKSSLPASKLRRGILKKRKTELKKKNEGTEGSTYESDVGLLGPLSAQIPFPSVDENLEPAFVIFDLETGDFRLTADVLQIAAKCNQFEFSVYIKPAQKISEQASAVHGLRFIDGVLQLHGNQIIAVSLSEAILGFLEFLCFLGRKCILTAHNCIFDYPRIMRAIEKVFMKDHFKCIVEGFCDTLPIIRKTTGNKTKGANKLESLATNLQIDNTNAHDAIADVKMLEQVLLKLNISNDVLKEQYFSWSAAENKIMFAQKLPKALNNLKNLKDCTSASIRKKIVSANITYEMIVEEYKKNSYEGLSNLLGKDEQNTVKVTKNKKVLQKLFDFLEKNIK